MENPKIIFTSGNVQNEINRLNEIKNKRKRKFYIIAFINLLLVCIGIILYINTKHFIVVPLNISLVIIFVLIYVYFYSINYTYENQLDFLDSIKNNSFRRYISMRDLIVQYQYSDQGSIKLKTFTCDEEEIREDIEENRFVFDNGRIIYQKPYITKLPNS